MTTASRYPFLISLALGMSLAAPAFAQLPWQAQPAPYAAPAPAPYAAPAPYYAAPAPAYAPRPRHLQVVTREQDDRHLDLLATRFYAVTSKDPQIVPKLRSLLEEVHAFRQELHEAPV